MNNAYVFGYGSLVNSATHTYRDAHPARVKGWRRTWRHTALRDVAFLTVIPDPDCEIEGLIAGVPKDDWPALDKRERAYVREVAQIIAHPFATNPDVRIYHVPHGYHAEPTTQNAVLLSYIDVVVQGYLRVFGEDGVSRFFETTDGWDAPIRDDRSAPKYSRHQQLTTHETDLVDANLARLGVTLQKS